MQIEVVCQFLYEPLVSEEILEGSEAIIVVLQSWIWIFSDVPDFYSTYSPLMTSGRTARARAAVSMPVIIMYCCGLAGFCGAALHG